MKKTFALTTTNGKLTCPELVGYELPEWEGQEEDVDAMAKEEYPEPNPYNTYQSVGNDLKISGFIKGYRKARDKFEFTEHHIKLALLRGYKLGKKNGSEMDRKSEEKNILNYLRTARTPIAIEVEGVREYIVPFGYDSDGVYCDKHVLNPDGTVKGRWVYE
jgi:hypothetical protein